MAHAQTTSLLNRADKRKPREREVIRKVGHAMVRVLLVRMRLLLATDVRASPRRSTLGQAQQCLAQWEKLIRWRFATHFEPADEVRLNPKPLSLVPSKAQGLLAIRHAGPHVSLLPTNLNQALNAESQTPQKQTLRCAL